MKKNLDQYVMSLWASYPNGVLVGVYDVIFIFLRGPLETKNGYDVLFSSTCESWIKFT